MKTKLRNGDSIERGRLLLIWPALYKLHRDHRALFDALWEYVDAQKPLTQGQMKRLAELGLVVDGRVPEDVVKVLKASYSPSGLTYPEVDDE